MGRWSYGEHRFSDPRAAPRNVWTARRGFRVVGKGNSGRMELPNGWVGTHFERRGCPGARRFGPTKVSYDSNSLGGIGEKLPRSQTTVLFAQSAKKLQFVVGKTFFHFWKEPDILSLGVKTNRIFLDSECVVCGTVNHVMTSETKCR